jgi:hypothetical protein
MALFDFDVTACKTTQKWQKEGHFTTPVPVDPLCMPMKPNKPLIAILMQREHNRLISQVNSLEKLLFQPARRQQLHRARQVC